MREKTNKILKTLCVYLLVISMMLSSLVGSWDVMAAEIPAPTINDVFIGATSISGGNVHKIRVKVGKKNETVIATVHVTLKAKDGTVKATFPEASISSKNWSVSLPSGAKPEDNIKVAEGDTVTVYQQIGEDKSPEVTVNAKDSLANQYKTNLTMPKLEVWSEDVHDLESDAVEDIVKAFTDENNKLADVDGKNFEKNLYVAERISDKTKGIDVSGDGKSITVTFSDKSTLSINISDKVTVKQITEDSNPAEVENLTVVDGEIKGKISGNGPFNRARVKIFTFGNETSKNNYCNGKCTVDKNAKELATIYVDETTGEFTYKVTDNKLLTLGEDIGITAKEYKKKNNCKTIQPSLVIPNVPVRDPKKLTDTEKEAIKTAIREANTVNGTSKLPDGTGFNAIKAYIDIDDKGNVKIYSGNDIKGSTVNGEFVPDRDESGNVQTKSGNNDNVSSINPDKLVTNLAPKQPTVSYKKETGEITVTPDPADTDAKTITVKYKDPDGNDQEIIVSKEDGENGKWSAPEGSKVTVNPDTGVVTIKDSDIQNKTNVSATVTDEGGIAANDKTPQNSKNGSGTIKIYPKKPEITVDGTTGDVTITPIDKDNDKVANKMDVTYTPVGETDLKTVTFTRDNEGKWSIEGKSDFKVSEDGKSITITNDKIKSKTDITAKTNDGDETEKLESEVETKNVPDKTAPKPPTVEVDTTDGNAHITPPTDPDVKTIAVKYPGADGNEKKFTATKTDTGWEISGDNGVTFDMSGYISIPYDKLKKADTISATAKDKDGNESKPGTDISLPPAPTAKENEGVITVTPPENTPSVNGMEITYTPDGSEETKIFKVVKGNDDKWKIDGEAIDGVTVNENGTVTIASGTAKEETKVTAISSIDTNKKSLEKGEAEVPETTAPEAPTVKVQEDGSVTITPKNEGETTVTVTYKDKDGQAKTATATKGKNNKWTVVGTNGEEINEDSGVITIPTGNTNPGDRVKATATKGSKTSEEGKDLTKPAPPTVTPNQETGDVTITPPAKGNVDGMIIKYKTPDDTDKELKVKKGEGGAWTFDGDTPEGVEVNGQSGVVTIKKGHAKEKTPVTADSTIERLQTPDKNQGEKPELVPDKTNPNPPTVKVEDNGSITITPPTDEDTTSVTVTYKKADNTEIKVKATKAGSTWSLTKEDGTPFDNGESVNENSGVITLAKGSYKTGEAVTAYGNDDANNQSTDGKDTPVEVSFDGDNGSTGSMESKILSVNGKYKLPANIFTRTDNKTFKGWQVGNETELRQVGFEFEVKANVVVKAVWEDASTPQPQPEPQPQPNPPQNVKNPSVSVDSNGNLIITPPSEGEVTSVSVSYKNAENTEKTPKAKKDEHGNWTIENNDNGETVDSSSGVITIPRGKYKLGEPVTAVANNNQTVSGEATETPVEVKLEKNDGSNNESNSIVIKNQFYVLPAILSLPEYMYTAPEGKEFDGWEVDGVKYAPRTQIQITKNTVLKAIWKEKGQDSNPQPNQPVPQVDSYNPWWPIWFGSSEVKPATPATPVKPVEEMERGIHRKYLYGYKDHTVRPEGLITRAEAAALIARLAELDMSNNMKPNFKDTKSAWYNTAINAVVAKNLMFADKDGDFRPNEPITRGEFARALFFIDKKNNAVAPFADVKGHVYEEAINQAYGNDRIKGYPDGTFKPDATITRAEAATILNNYADRNVTFKGMVEVHKDVVKFTDINESHWAYYEIMEAANTHEYQRTKGTIPETWLEILKK